MPKNYYIKINNLYKNELAKNNFYYILIKIITQARLYIVLQTKTNVTEIATHPPCCTSFL